MNNVDREREREKRDNDRGEPNREEINQRKKTPQILVDPQKRTPPPRNRGCPPFFPSPKGHLIFN
jgi:hypothetical protein